MANEVLVKASPTPVQVRFFVTGSFSPADAATNMTDGTPNDVAMTSASLADAAGRQSAKADLGALRAGSYSVMACVDYTGLTPTSGATVDYYWLPSTNATAANGNIAGNSGLDAAAPGGAVPAGLTITEFKRMAQRIGSLTLSDDGAVQNGYVGTFSPATRWGQLLEINEGGADFAADDVEHHVVMNPIVDEIQ